MTNYKLGFLTGGLVIACVAMIGVLVTVMTVAPSGVLVPYKARVICRGLDGTDQAGWTRLHKADFYMLSDPKYQGRFIYKEDQITLECHVAGSPSKTFQAFEGYWRWKP